MDDQDIYELLGEETLRSIVHGFYRRVATDDLLGPLYPPEDLAGAELRLADFLVYRFGGPPVYLERRGHPRLRMRHAPFPVDDAARRRWLQLMSASLEEHQVPPEAKQIVWQYFESTAQAMMNRQPGG